MFCSKDWVRVKGLFKDWWDGVLDKPLIQVYSPKLGFEDYKSWDSWGFARNLEEPEPTIEGFIDYCRRTFFGGGAYPNLWVNLGPGVLAAYLGAEPRFKSETVWFQTPKPWSELEGLKFNLENYWWRKTKNITIKVVERSLGRFMVGITDLGGILDILASLRGTLNLIKDLFYEGFKVRKLSNLILDFWHGCYEELYRIIESSIGGSSSWMGLWCHKRYYPIQCDFAYMLSPSKFKEYALPTLEEQCRRLDYTVYHLDGVGQIPHLNLLLSIKELNAIQWVPGEGKPGPESLEWLTLYRRIQEAGKNLVLDVSLKGLKPLLRELKPRGLLVKVWAGSQSEAEKILEELYG